MKHLIYNAIFLFSAVSFGQNTGLIVGKILDKELNDSPLLLANVSIKGSLTEVSTDMTGLFVIENLEAGSYTLICSFTGYETKEINVQVDGLHAVEITLSLAASSISLNDLALITNTAHKDDDLLSVLN